MSLGYEENPFQYFSLLLSDLDHVGTTIYREYLIHFWKLKEPVHWGYWRRHETPHMFHILGSDFGCQYDGILGQDFWKDNEASINYCNLTITKGEVTMNLMKITGQRMRRTNWPWLKTLYNSLLNLKDAD